MRTLSVIVVTYKHCCLVDDLLKSIDKYNDLGEELQVIIVDNSPNEEVFDLISANKYQTTVRYIKNENNGYGCANNIGAKYADTEYLLFLNPDTRLVAPIFCEAIRTFEKYDMFGGQLLNVDRGKNFSFRYNTPYTLMSAINNRIIKLTNKFNNRKHYILGADIFIKADAFFKIGGFDEQIFMYNEEFDISRRLLVNNYKIGFNSKIKLIHLEGSGEYKHVDITSRKRFLVSLRYVCQKYGMNYRREIKRQRSFLMLRKFISKILFKNTDDLHEMIKMYNAELESASGDKNG